MKLLLRCALGVYDDARGWYAGLFLSTVEFGGPDGRELQAIVFAGHAWRTASGEPTTVTWCLARVTAV